MSFARTDLFIIIKILYSPKLLNLVSISLVIVCIYVNPLGTECDGAWVKASRHPVGHTCTILYSPVLLKSILPLLLYQLCWSSLKLRARRKWQIGYWKASSPFPWSSFSPGWPKAAATYSSSASLSLFILCSSVLDFIKVLINNCLGCLVFHQLYSY